MNFANRMGRLASLIDGLILWCAAIPLVLMMLHISMDVVSNLVFNQPVPLTNAIVTQYYMIAVAFLPLAAAEIRRSHISVDLLVNNFAPLPKLWVDLLMQLISLSVCSALVMQSWQLALEKLERDAYLMEQTSRFTIWPSYFIVPIGFGLMVLLMLVRVGCQLAGSPLPEIKDKPIAEESHV
jgi:hypothetical protein